MEKTLSDKFFKKGQDFFKVKYPIMCGAMTWVSNPSLVASISKAEGFGCLAGGNTPPEILEDQIIETQKLTTKPFGLNIITIAPSYKEHLALIQKHKLSYIIFAGSFPRENEIKIAKNTGAKVICFASTFSIAKRMVNYGADAIILEGMEAGGHVGHVSLSVLLQQVLFEMSNIPIFVAGGIATGKMAAHMFLMGAAGVQLGTRFAASIESPAHIKFKEKFIQADARDAVSTPQFDSRLPVVAVRALKNKGMDDFGVLQLELINKLNKSEIHRHEAQIEVEKFWMGALRKAVQDGDIQRGSLMAGQSVGLVNKIMSVEDIMKELVEDIEKELLYVKSLFND